MTKKKTHLMGRPGGLLKRPYYRPRSRRDLLRMTQPGSRAGRYLIEVDGSHNPTLNLVSYGLRVISHKRCIHQAAERQSADDRGSLMAELWALHAALCWSEKHTEPGDEIIVHSDCQVALMFFYGHEPRFRGDTHALLQGALGLYHLLKRTRRLTLRWVPRHKLTNAHNLAAEVMDSPLAKL